MARTPLARARGLGSARGGSGHWKMQRLTGIANLLLVIWFLFAAMSLSGAGYAEVTAWLQAPLPAALMVLLVISTFYHARLGLQVVVEDYVHHEGIKIASLVAITLVCFLLASACVIAVLQVALKG